MSIFSGPQGKGAMRRHCQIKRIEAEARQEKAILVAHPDGKCDCKTPSFRREMHFFARAMASRDRRAEELLQRIFAQ